jgi:hypothetical protein
VNCLKEPERSDDVRLDEVFGAVDGSVYVALGSEVDNGLGLVFAQQLIKESAISNVAQHEMMPVWRIQTRKILKIAGVCQSVQIDSGIAALVDPAQYEIASDEAGSSSDKNVHS